MPKGEENHGFRHSPAGADEIPGLIVLVPSEDNPTQDPYTPEEGDLLVGQTAPLGFARYPFDPADSSSTRNVLAGDQGDTKPTWKALLDGTDPAAVAEDASPGTSLIAAHRDHVHRSNKLLRDYEAYERIIITAHRGDMNATDGYPEGTLEGYRLAAEKGVNRVDLDLRQSSQSTWYIMHDATVDRTTGGTGAISGKTDSQVDALQIDGGVGYVAARHASPAIRVPTLASVIEALRPYDITYQFDNKIGTSGATSLAQFAVTNEIVHRVTINAYSQAEADAIEAVDPRIAIMSLTAESGYVQYDWDSGYTISDVQGNAPLQTIVLVPIEDFGTADEGEVVTEGYAKGVRVFTVNDIDAALEAKAGIISGGSSSGGGPSEVSFGSEAADGEGFINDSGAEAFTQFGNITRLFGLNNFAFDTPKVVFEANLKTNDSGLTAKARLYDITDGAVVAGSAIQTTSETPDRIRSGYLTIDDAEHEYRAEFGGVDTVEPTIYGARVLAGTSTMVSEGSDGETSPPVAASVGDDVANEIRNFPSLEKADDAQPEWWEEADANATLTEVDLAGEGITEKYERALKVVVATANSYAYQQFTYADEPRLKSGKTYSVAVDVWAVGGVTARIRLQSSAGSLGASLDTTAAAWTTLEVEGVALNGTTLQIRLEVDIGTAYFVPLGLVEGTTAPTTQLRPRAIAYRHIDPVRVLNASGSADPAAWTDIDVTANTSPLAAMALIHLRLREPDGTTNYLFDVRRNGSSKAIADDEALAKAQSTNQPFEERIAFVILLDDQQIFEYILDRIAGAGTVDVASIYVDGYWEWE